MTWPDGQPLELDPRARRLAAGRVLLGGAPGRLLRLGTAGPQALVDLECGAPTHTPAVRKLGRSLVDAGLAHPRPRPVSVAEVTVVIPVKDRTGELAACLSRLTGLTVLVVDDGSRDPAAVAAVARTHGAEVLHCKVSGGPGVARNTGLARVSTAFAAVVDSDVLVPPGWLEELLGHFADPRLAAVAPRIVGAPGSSTLARYAAARSPLDLGRRAALVRPGSPVAYLPTAVAVLRMAALPRPVFDPQLRYGEDVDLFWRLHDQGWLVRYDPSVVAEHSEPMTWNAWYRRRFAYGTSAAPLSVRHPQRLTPIVLRPWPTLAAVLLLARRPALAAAVAAVPTVRLARTLSASGVPRGQAALAAGRLVATGIGGTALGTGSTLAVVGGPVGWLAAGWMSTGRPAVGRRATRRPVTGRPATRRPAVGRSGQLAVLLAAPPLLDWWQRRPALDPLRWTALRLADDAAYGAGLWWGCWRHRTLRPVRPATSPPR